MDLDLHTKIHHYRIMETQLYVTVDEWPLLSRVVKIKKGSV